MVTNAQANFQRVPPEFLHQQQGLEFGQDASGGKTHPILIKSQDQEDAAPTGSWLMDRRGIPYQKTWK